MRILVINGPNLNMVGIREKNIYGEKTYGDLCRLINEKSAELGLITDIYQSTHEGDLVDKIQSAYTDFDALIINAGAYTHTSIAILDALKAVNKPAVEVHLSDINAREDFRKLSYVGMYAEKTIAGKGFDGYIEALEYFA